MQNRGAVWASSSRSGGDGCAGSSEPFVGTGIDPGRVLIADASMWQNFQHGVSAPRISDIGRLYLG